MILMALVPIGLTTVPVMIYQVRSAMCRRRSSLVHYIWTYVMMIYIWLVFSVAGIGSVWDIFSRGGLIGMLQQADINLLPFQSEGIFTYSMNVIMFMPLGSLLPFIWKEYRELWKIVLAGAIFSLFIELAQLPTNRLADVDDLLMNTLGAVLGYAVWKLVGRYFFRKREGERTRSLGRFEAVIYLFLACACNFLLYDQTWFWNVLICYL